MRSTPWIALRSCTTATSERSRKFLSARWRRRDSYAPPPAAPAPPHEWGGVTSDLRLTFMGTAGARFMVAKQVAASGGLYVEDGTTRLALDPGPGAIVQYAQRGIDLTTLDAIVLSHRHLDHSGDVNVMLEAMTDGGFQHRGQLFCPSDALDDDPVVLKYVRRFPREIVRLSPETTYAVNGLSFTTSGRHVHQSETYGFRFGDRLGGITVWRANPAEIAAGLSQRTGIEVRAAHDGMSVDL